MLFTQSGDNMDPSYAPPEGNVLAPPRMLWCELGRIPEGGPAGWVRASESFCDFPTMLRGFCTLLAVQPTFGRGPRYGRDSLASTDLDGMFLQPPPVTPPTCQFHCRLWSHLAAGARDPMPISGLGATFKRLPSGLAAFFLQWARDFCSSCRAAVLGFRLLLFLHLCSAVLSQFSFRWSYKGWAFGLSTRVWQPGIMLTLGATYSPCQRAMLEGRQVPAKRKRGDKRKRRPQAAVRCGFAGSSLVAFLFGCSCLPTCVWAAPPGLSDAVEEVNYYVQGLPEALQASGSAPGGQASDPDRAPAAQQEDAGSQRNVPAAGLHNEQERGVPAPTQVPGMPMAETVSQVPFAAYVITPFYHAETFTFQLQLPCEEMDSAREVSRHMTGPVLAYTDVIAPDHVAIAKPTSGTRHGLPLRGLQPLHLICVLRRLTRQGPSRLLL